MPERFTLTVELGNAAMSTPEDVADALREVADALEAGASSGIVRDVNGNTVGRWELA
jgi:hypothetical protein